MHAPIQWYEAYLQGTIPTQGRAVLGKDLCDMSGAKGRTPDAYTVYNVMLPRKYHPAIQNNLFEKRTKVLLMEDIYYI